jgi:signal transduction histidine kinase
VILISTQREEANDHLGRRCGGTHVKDRDEFGRLVEEQAGLRRVATLVARGASAVEVFAAVAREVAQVLHLNNAMVGRYDDEGATVTVLAVWGKGLAGFLPGSSWPLDGPSVSAEVFRTSRPTEVEDYTDVPGTIAAEARGGGFMAVAGAPIIVDGQVWGVISTSSPAPPLAEGLEDRLADFTELVATAIANSQAREELTRLAEEQAALRRVATLVAQGARPAAVFEVVSAEVARLIPADAAALSHYETDGTVTALGGWSKSGGYMYSGRRFTLEGTVSGLVLETGGPRRMDYSEDVGPASAAARDMGWRSSVGVPVIVEGSLWGVMAVVSTTDKPLPADTEGRLGQFTALMATAIANTSNRAELDASRARIVATADATRRRIERDLHDGAQQQLFSLALDLRAAQETIPEGLAELRAEVSEVVDGLTSVLDDLREIAHGIHPAILAEGGLGPALRNLARRSAVPVKLDVTAKERLPEPVEVAAYYVVAEALTNATKYARASLVHVEVEARDSILRIAVRDDGLGGADPASGSGLLGLRDRTEAVGGKITLESPRGVGTSLHVELPLDDTSV